MNGPKACSLVKEVWSNTVFSISWGCGQHIKDPKLSCSKETWSLFAYQNFRILFWLIEILPGSPLNIIPQHMFWETLLYIFLERDTITVNKLSDPPIIVLLPSTLSLLMLLFPQPLFHISFPISPHFPSTQTHKKFDCHQKHFKNPFCIRNNAKGCQKVKKKYPCTSRADSSSYICWVDMQILDNINNLYSSKWLNTWHVHGGDEE